MFSDDQFDELPTRLQQQKEELKRHLSKYGLHYPVFLMDSYSGTDEKLAKTRDVTLNHRNTFHNESKMAAERPALSDSRAALVATKRGSDKR